VNGDEPPLEGETRETLKAYVKYAMTFSHYIKENDPVLWKRAMQYASDCTQSDTVSFNPKEVDDA
jgi:hypothetical protein